MKARPGQVLEPQVHGAGIEQPLGNHGVEGQGLDRAASLLQHDQVILDVVSLLGDVGAGQEGVEGLQDGLQGEFGIARWGLDRDVGAALGGVGERDAHQAGLHGVDGGGLRVDRQRRCALEAGDQAAQRGFIGDDLVLSHGLVRRRDPFGLGLPLAKQGELVGHAGRLQVLWLRQTLDEGVELQPVEEIEHLVVVEAADAAGVEIELRGGVADDPGQLAAEERLLTTLLEPVAEAGGYLVQVLVDPLQGSVLLEQPGGGLLAHAVDTGDVVRLVAHEGLVVHQLVRAEALVALLHLLDVVDDGVGEAPAGGQHPGALIDQLEQVHVAGDDERIDVLVLGLPGEGPEEVVGLVPFLLEDGDVQGLHDRPDAVHLRAELVRHLGAVGLVLGVDLVAEGAPLVEGHGDVGGLLVAQDVQQHGRESVDGVGQLALRGLEIVGQRVVGAVGEGVTVDQNQLLPFRHNGVLAPPSYGWAPMRVRRRSAAPLARWRTMPSATSVLRAAERITSPATARE